MYSQFMKHGQKNIEYILLSYNTQTFMVNDQLDAQFFSIYLSKFSTCF